MKIKQFFNLLMIMICALFIVGCSSNTSNQPNEEEQTSEKVGEETITLKVASGYPPTSATNESFAIPWMERVTELTDGKVQFDFYPSEQLGKGSDMLPLTRNGTTDLAMAGVNYFPDTMPISNMLVGMPGLFETANQGINAYLDLLDKNEELVQSEFTNQGIRLIGVFGGPPYLLWTKDKEVKNPEDLKNLKIRSAGGVSTEFLEYAGAVPITMSVVDVLEGFDRNVVEGVILNADNIFVYGLDGSVNYGLPELGFSSTFVNLIINEKVFQNLPDDVKEIFIQVGQEVSLELGKKYNEIEASAIDKMVANGIMSELTAEEKGKWEDFFADFRQSWLEENKDSNIPYGEMLEKFINTSENFKSN